MKRAVPAPNGENNSAQESEYDACKKGNLFQLNHMISVILDRLWKIGHGETADRLYDKFERPRALPPISLELPAPAAELVVAALHLHVARLFIHEDRADEAISAVASGVGRAVLNGAMVVQEEAMEERQRERGAKAGASKRAVRNWYLKKAEASFAQDAGASGDATEHVMKRKVSDRAHRQMSDHRRLWMRGTKGDTAAAGAFSRLSAPGYKELLLGPWARKIPTKESLYSYYLDSLKRQQMEDYIQNCARARDEYEKKTTD